MTLRKPKLDPAKLKPVSGRDRMTIEQPVRVVKKPPATKASEAETSVAGVKGAAKLHEYWTAGKGLAKWADSPEPWTTLRDHLLKFMDPEEATKTASAWFIDVFHFAAGSDLNRVTHGKPPRGHVVGPG